MCGTSSARPARLLRYGDLCGAVADGLRERAGALESAVERYRSRNEAAFRYDCGGVVDAVRQLAGATGDVGEWVAGVGRGFLEAGRWVPIGDGVEDVAAATDEQLAPAIDTALPPLTPVAVPATPGGTSLADVGSITQADGPSGWDQVSVGSEAVSQVGEVLVGLAAGEGGELAAVTRVVDLDAVGRAANGVAVGLSALGAGMSAWDDGAALSDAARLESAVLHAGLTAGGGWAGSALAGGACTASVAAAPFTPLCAMGGGFVGGVLGGLAAELLDDDPGPGDHDEDAVADEIADLDEEAVDLAGQLTAN